MKKQILLTIILATFILPSFAQKNNTTTGPITSEGYRFTPLIDLKATSVKDQGATGTCWCFATTSFIESELIRMGKGEYDLSEMFIVRQNYIDKLKDNYLRLGKGNTGEGSLAHDWMRVFTESGITPGEFYNGLNYGSPIHDHGELQAFVDAVASVPVKRRNESDQYYKIVDDVLDTYLGQIPGSFTFKSVTYTPLSFAESLGINPDDYVEITSFTHFPYYSRGVLEVPDNWSMARFYNVHLDELIEIMDYSFSKGYTVNWDGDVSETGFSQTNGIAVIPETPAVKTWSGNDGGESPRNGRVTWPANLSGSGPGPEVNVTQNLRQTWYENFKTTDDHLMHMTGIAKDQNGTKYYKTKNSWGTGNNPFGGYLYMSESYIKAKTIFIMVNKNAIPPAIKTKLGL